MNCKNQPEPSILCYQTNPALELTRKRSLKVRIREKTAIEREGALFYSVWNVEDSEAVGERRLQNPDGGRRVRSRGDWSVEWALGIWGYFRNFTLGFPCAGLGGISTATFTVIALSRYGTSMTMSFNCLLYTL